MTFNDLKHISLYIVAALLASFAYPKEMIRIGLSDYHAVCNLAPVFC